MKKIYFILIFMLTLSMAQAQNFVEVGSGTASTPIPAYTPWNYGWSSIIYTAEDLGGEMNISAIGLDMINTDQMILTDQKIYAKLTSASSFEGSLAYENPESNGYTLVFDGDITFENGWNEITLLTPVAYNGTDNLIIHWEHHMGESSYVGPNFNSETIEYSSYLVKVLGDDTAFPGAGNGWGFSNYPNMRFYYSSEGPATPQNPNPASSSMYIAYNTGLQFTLDASTTDYEILFGTDASALNSLESGVSASEGNNTYTLEGNLQANTTYYWQVIANDGTYTTNSPVWNFTTEVVISSFPFYEGFEDETALPDYPAYGTWEVSPEFTWNAGDYAHNGLKSAYISNFHYEGNAILKTPRIILNDNYRLKYYWLEGMMDASKGIGHDTLYVEISTDNGNTWTELAAHTSEESNDFIEVNHDLSAYNGTEAYIRFRDASDNTLDGHSTSIDDISLSPISANSEIWVSDYTINFPELYQNGSTYLTIEVANIGTQDLVIDNTTVAAPFYCDYSGTIAPEDTVDVVITFNPMTEYGSQNVSLTFNISSAFTGLNEISLLGDALEPSTSLYEGFDLAEALPAHWNKIRNEEDTYNDITVHQSSYDAISAPNYVKLLNANDSIFPLTLVSEGVTGFDTHTLTFSAKSSGENVQLYVGIMEDPYHAESFDTIGTFTMAMDYTEFSLTFDAGNVYPYIAFLHGAENAWTSIRMDDIVWENPVANTAPNPAVVAYPVNESIDFNLNEAYLIWSNGGGNPESYNLYFGSDNPPTNIVNGDNLGDVLVYEILNDLEYNTEYFWQVVPENTNGTAESCPVWSFTTMEDPTVSTFPFNENFDGITAQSAYAYPPYIEGWTYPLGWTVLNENTDNMSWDALANNPTFSDNAHSAPNAMHVAMNFMEPMNDWLITPAMELDANMSYTMSFYYRMNNYFGEYPEKLEVFWGTEPNAASMNLAEMFNNDNILNNEYTLATGTFSPDTDGVYYLGFHGYSDPGMFIIAIDDVLVTEQAVAVADNNVTEFSIYPNPAENMSYIVTNLNNYDLEVADMTGKIVYRNTNLSAMQSIDISNFETGLYMVRISKDGQSTTRKLMVK